MRTLACSRCGTRVATIDDTRFPALPAATLCLRCSHPAWDASMSPPRHPAPGVERE